MSSTFMHAFPLEGLGSDIARNNYNYESIFNGLMEWNSSKRDTVTVRLTKSTYPYFHDYTFPTKYATTANLDDTYVKPIAGGAYSYTSRFALSASSDANNADSVTLRVTIGDNGKTTWKPYIEAFVYDGNMDSTDYVKGSVVRVHTSDNSNKIYIVNKQDSTVPLTLSELIENGYAVQYVRDYIGSMTVYPYDGVLYEGNLYIANIDDDFHMDNVPPTNYESGSFVQVATLWNSTESYNKGDYVTAADSDGNYHTFVNLLEDGTNVTNPIDYLGTWSTYNSLPSYTENDDTDKAWAEVVLFPVFSSKSLKSSTVVRFVTPTDIKSIVLRNDSDMYAEVSTSVTMTGNISYKVDDSKYEKKVGYYNTSNYCMYPEDTSSIWSTGTAKFDSSVSGNKRQTYSASMIFDHGEAGVSTVNYINYDGPDLDQGLCIYLPVTSVAGNETSTPEDGFTFEFFFRIWPTTSYNGAVTSDNIINKAQIYIYSVPTADDAKMDTCGTPIAKFSMARLTNFYVYDENIAVANRPVMYRATIIYSAEKSAWEVFDYYQLPDHVFVGPVGFVDPTNVGKAADQDDDYTGLETAGFPMFSDPFE